MDYLWLPFAVKSDAKEMMLVFRRTTSGRTFSHKVVADFHVGKAADWFSGLELPLKKTNPLFAIKFLDAFPGEVRRT